MRCPFLREAQVKYCRASVYKKMIVRLSEQTENERCSSRTYVDGPAAKQYQEERPAVDHCPFLQESLVQYCNASAVTKYIPYSESLNSPCGLDSHKYCELFLSLAQPTEASSDAPVQNEMLDDLRIPAHLRYTPNHLWIESGADGTCHIGVDAFMAKVLGSAEHLTFVTTKGYHRPTVSFTVHGTEMQFVFPVPMTITRANTYLRTHPEKVFADPYTVGWLFEGNEDTAMSARFDGFITGDAVRPWMEKEMQRMATFAHHLTELPGVDGTVMMTDGGQFRTGIVRHLAKAAALALYNDFFSPLTLWNKQ